MLFKPHKRAGFTLIELMITLVVIALLAMLAAPSITSTLSAQRTYDAARATALEMKKARYRAQSLNRAVGLRISATENAVFTRLSPDNQCSGLLTASEVKVIDVQNRYPDAVITTGAQNDGLDELICVRPSGQIAQASTGLPFGTADATLYFFIARHNGVGNIHEIELPFNGIARLVR